MAKIRMIISQVLQPKPLLIFAGVLALGLVANSFIQLFQVSPIDYAAVKWQIFWTFALVISFTMLWFYVSIMTD